MYRMYNLLKSNKYRAFSINLSVTDKKQEMHAIKSMVKENGHNPSIPIKKNKEKNQEQNVRSNNHIVVCTIHQYP